MPHSLYKMPTSSSLIPHSISIIPHPSPLAFILFFSFLLHYPSWTSPPSHPPSLIFPLPSSPFLIPQPSLFNPLSLIPHYHLLHHTSCAPAHLRPLYSSLIILHAHPLYVSPYSVFLIPAPPFLRPSHYLSFLKPELLPYTYLLHHTSGPPTLHPSYVLHPSSLIPYLSFLNPHPFSLIM